MSRQQFALFLLLITTAMLSACGPGKLPAQKIGKPYVINGESYYPSYDASYDKTGTASWYGPGFHGKYTASGEVYDQNDYTAAHPTLPMPSLVRVTNLENGKSVVVRVNDRGPFAGNRLIDLSKKSAQELGIHGLAQVRVQFLERETQEYLAMVKNNEGKIIPMAEYHSRAETQVAAQEEPVNEEIEVAENDAAIPAPTLTVVQDEVKPEPVIIVERPAEAETKTGAGNLFVAEAAAEELPAAALKAAVAEASPAAGEAPPTSVMAESTGKYTIQAGAFSSESNAHKLVGKLKSVGDTAIDQIISGGKTLWRVRVGAFAAPDYAEEVLAQVKSYVPDAKIVKK